MINLYKFRIIQLDRYNLTFEEFKEVENKATKEKIKKWVRVGGYYANLQQVTKALKDYLLYQQFQDKNSYSIKEVIEYLDDLNNSYVNCIITPMEDTSND